MAILRERGLTPDPLYTAHLFMYSVAGLSTGAHGAGCVTRPPSGDDSVTGRWQTRSTRRCMCSPTARQHTLVCPLVCPSVPRLLDVGAMDARPMARRTCPWEAASWT